MPELVTDGPAAASGAPSAPRIPGRDGIFDREAAAARRDRVLAAWFASGAALVFLILVTWSADGREAARIPAHEVTLPAAGGAGNDTLVDGPASVAPESMPFVTCDLGCGGEH
ncbi:MAG TPA: hypothetical protein VMN39_01585 [Longimicrobiaceae bacterium]|nr:hypothetical protein [Longimicrobiaceae bacterium]